MFMNGASLSKLKVPHYASVQKNQLQGTLSFLRLLYLLKYCVFVAMVYQHLCHMLLKKKTKPRSIFEKNVYVIVACVIERLLCAICENGILLHSQI